MVESSFFPKPATGYGLGRSWTLEDTRTVDLEMWCRETGCGFESRALRSLNSLKTNGFRRSVAGSR